jgi:hypothetical protein
MPSKTFAETMHSAAEGLRREADAVGNGLGRVLAGTADLLDDAAFRGDTHGQAFRLAQIYLAGEAFLTGPSYED